MHSKQSVLEDLDIGNGVAELERVVLGDFFLESIEWKKLKNGKIDLVLGPKGSGKSALFFHLLDHEDELHSSNILIVSSENTAGDSVFSTISSGEVISEDDFVRVWKLYFLVLILETLKKNGITTDLIQKIEELLGEEGVYERGWSLRQLFANVTHYVKSRLYFNSADGEVEFTEAGAPKKLRAKLSFDSASIPEQKAGVVPIDSVLQLCNNTLAEEGKDIWILVDRLDAIFPSDKESEKNALRALVRTYGGFRSLPSICPKIFLRDDIWASITRQDGFREASHLSPVTARLHWSKSSLAELLLKRLLSSEEFRNYYNKDENFVKSNSNDKLGFLYSLFPERMNIYGENTQVAFDWLIMHTMDGKDVNAPRDLIELMNAAIEYEITRLSKGDRPYRRKNLLFNHEGLAHAGVVLSKTKMEQTIFAEYPDLRHYIDALMDSSGRNFDVEKMCEQWEVNRETAVAVCTSLSEVGVLKKSGKDRYLIPVLYTGYLRINPSRKKFDG